MKVQLPNPLARALRSFFMEYLPLLRGVSPHTVLSYRDSLVLLLRFVSDQHKRPVVSLDFDDLATSEIIAFLTHLEVRGNTISTRNIRLAAIHSFFRYVAEAHPDRLEHCQRVLAIPFKRSETRVIEYLEYEEMKAVLAAINRSTRDGRRDYTLMVTFFNTGGRVQEIVDLRACDLQLIPPLHVRFFGKGRKERICSILPETAQVLKQHCADQHIDLRSDAPLFVSRQRARLTRFGAYYIVTKYFRQAQKTTPSLAKKRLHPHSLRHTTAVHYLKAGADLSSISQLLGHASINTTNIYTKVDLEMKREAIAKATPLGQAEPGLSSWRRDPTILEWLEAL